MENNHKKIDIKRTEEIQDIIEKMPRNTGRIVIWIIVGLSTILLLLGWFIKYPEVAKGAITISAKVSPVKLVSKVSGKLLLLNHKSNCKVKKGEIFAMIESSADLKSVMIVDSLLMNFNPDKPIDPDILCQFPQKINLGEMTDIYFRFLNALELTVRFPAKKNYQFQKEDNKLAILSQNDILRHLDSLRRVKEEYKKIVANLLRKDSLQYYKIKGIAETELDKSKLNFCSSQENSLSIQKDINNTKNQLKALNNKYNQLMLEELSYQQKTNIDLISSYGTLRYGIQQWLLNYTFKAPFAGKLEFIDFWKQNDFVETGKELFSVLPEKNYLEGNVYLPISGAGKVKIGQHVNIKLDNFPYNEYGIVAGNVTNISFLAGKKLSLSDNQTTYAYLITIALPNKLITNYGTNLGFQYEAKGIAEIITDKRRLIERLFDNLKYIAKK